MRARGAGSTNYIAATDRPKKDGDHAPASWKR
jgi:hypothetical protein